METDPTDGSLGTVSSSLLPLRTDRLVLRMLRPDDAVALAGWRNDPAVARFQGWPLPFTVDDARALLAAQVDHHGPVLGAWVQIGIEHAGELAGDVALGLDPTGRLASLGYSLRVASQGQGVATEAVGAMIDALFDQAGVHRVSASVDPDNLASARVLERLGFRSEGRAVRAVDVRGQWCDDEQYALLREDRDAWRSRPRHRPREVRLVELSPANLPAVLALETHPSQRRFVAPVTTSLAQALVPDQHHGATVVPWYRAIEADGEIVGFVMLAEPTHADPVPYLWRLSVDRRHQGRGIGAGAVALVVDRARALGATDLEVSWVEGRGSPRGFYVRLGFEPTGEIVDSETVARRRL
jgi:RimJ/RimL family protein N-acetyltransferase